MARGRKPKLTVAERGLVAAECERKHRQTHGGLSRSEIVRQVSEWAMSRLPHAGQINAAMALRCWDEYRKGRP